MPELANVRGVNLNAPVFRPEGTQGYYQAPIADTRAASALAGKAALNTALAESLKNLPTLLNDSYDKARKAQTANATRGEYERLLSGGQASPNGLQLSDFKVDATGGVTANPEDPILRNAKLEYYNRKAVPVTTFQDRLNLDAPAVPVSLGGQLQNITPVESPATSATGATEAPASGDFISWVKGMEGYSPKAYSDSGQVSVGYGTRGQPGEVLDEAAATARLQQELASHQARIDGLSQRYGVSLTPAQKEALTSFDFNTGRADRIFEVSARDGQLDPEAAKSKMAEYIHADARAKDGVLKSRRQKEIQRFGANDAANQAIQEGVDYATGQLSSISPAELSAANQAGPIPAASIKPAPALAGFDPTKPIMRPTIGRDPSTGETILAPTPDRVTAVRGNTLRDITPAKSKDKEEEGLRFPTAAAAAAAGYDPTGAKVNADGSVNVTSFKASGTDAKGRAKITDNQKNSLSSAATLAKEIDGMLGKYDDLAKNNMAGPIMGRVEKGKQALGLGSEQGSQAQAEMNTSLFRIARMLNGAGVLTDKDIQRATNVAPTITMGRDQFKGQLEAVKGTIREGLETWISANAGQATDEQIELAKKAIESLTAAKPEAKASAPAAASSASSEDSEAANWVKANPNDPRAARIKAALKARGVSVD